MNSSLRETRLVAEDDERGNEDSVGVSGIHDAEMHSLPGAVNELVLLV